MHLDGSKDASSVKKIPKYAKLKSNVSLSLSLMSELKKSFLINCGSIKQMSIAAALFIIEDNQIC